MRVFDLFADRYDSWYETPFGRSAFELELRCLKEVLPKFSKGLEVGVGTGRFAEALGVRYGIDTSLKMILKAKERGVVPVLGRAESLPFRDGAFDLVLIVVTLCFVEDPRAVLREVRRVLRPGGVVLLGLILRESSWAEFYIRKGKEGHPIYREAKFYSLREVDRMLREADMRITSVLSTIIEGPQNDRPVGNEEIREGFHPEAGFTCIRAEPL